MIHLCTVFIFVAIYFCLSLKKKNRKMFLSQYCNLVQFNWKWMRIVLIFTFVPAKMLKIANIGRDLLLDPHSMQLHCRVVWLNRHFSRRFDAMTDLMIAGNVSMRTGFDTPHLGNRIMVFACDLPILLKHRMQLLGVFSRRHKDLDNRFLIESGTL